MEQKKANLVAEKYEKETFIWDGNVAGRIKDNKSDYYLKDELGSPIRFVNEEGSLRDTYGYDEFGNDLHNNQEITQPFGYTGYQIDSISKTYFAQAREYKSEIGRLETQDKIEGKFT